MTAVSTAEWDADRALDDLTQALLRRVKRTYDLPWDQLRESAVLALLQLVNGIPHVLFTERHQNLRHHAGQISFPGGARDLQDSGAEATALRELEEELGISRAAVRILGELDEIPTPTGFRIAPYVGLLAAEVTPRPNPAEVAQLIEVPLTDLFLPGRPRIERRMVQGRGWDVYFYETGAHVIWGATAHILRGLLDEMQGLPSWNKWTHR